MDDFELLRVIGRGSYAKVFMVEQKTCKRYYAMKVIKKELVNDDEVIVYKLYGCHISFLTLAQGNITDCLTIYHRTSTGCRPKSMCSKWLQTTHSWLDCIPASKHPAGKLLFHLS